MNAQPSSMPTGIWRMRPSSTRMIFSPVFTTSTCEILEAEKEKEIYHAKIDFFTNIAHE